MVVTLGVVAADAVGYDAADAADMDDGESVDPAADATGDWVGVEDIDASEPACGMGCGSAAAMGSIAMAMDAAEMAPSSRLL